MVNVDRPTQLIDVRVLALVILTLEHVTLAVTLILRFIFVRENDWIVCG